jgi:Fe-S cluster biogenesis protein NfuA
MSVSREALEARVTEINALMRAHAGAIELMEVTEAGTVTVRFVGKCTGCELRPVTMVSTVRPGLLAVAEVRGVRVLGVRISEEAEQRMADSLGAGHPSRLMEMFESSRAVRGLGIDGERQKRDSRPVE